MKAWDHPPKTKIYEALGAVADERVVVKESNEAKVYSSSGNKFYTVSYDPEEPAIMANDNSSFWVGYLGYPAIAFLMKKGVLSYEEKMGSILKGVKWKDINQRFKNDLEKALDFILSSKIKSKREALEQFVDSVDTEIKKLNLKLLGGKTKPPAGY